MELQAKIIEEETKGEIKEEKEVKKKVKEEEKPEVKEEKSQASKEETEEVKENKETKKKEKIGIRIPPYLAYPILAIVLALLIFMVYRAITVKRAKDEVIDVTADTEKSENILQEPQVIPLESITLSETNIELKIGESNQITAVALPEEATYKEILWESSNNKIATVENGLIKAIKDGSAIITAYNKENDIKVECKVVVKPIEVQSVSLDETSVKLGVGQNYILLSSIEPSNATYKEIVWSSSNSNVATVKNGQIKAVGEGTVVITATSKNGKKASCTFNVSSTAPENPVRYVSDWFNVRIGPGESYSKLDATDVNDEIEILKETSKWAKIRIKRNGVVGYTVLKSYSTSKKYYINNVPYINQHSIGLPTGCEAVSATMAAQYAGYNIGVWTIINNTPTDPLGKRQETRVKEVQTEVLNEETGEIEVITTTTEETVWVGENPFKYFVGYPTKKVSEGSYGCYAAPIASALSASGVSCTNISGCSVNTLYNYIEQGKPVVVWGRARAGDLNPGVTWQYPDGSGEYQELVGEHCFVLIGYDGDKVYLNDPSVGKGVTQPRWKFESNWYKLYNQEIIIN